MAHWSTFVVDIKVNKIWEQFPIRILKEGDIKKDVNYCGLIRMYYIKWHQLNNIQEILSAVVDLYVAPFSKIASKKKQSGWTCTAHKAMLLELCMWDNFENFIGRVRDTDGNLRSDYDITKESELFYGFLRRDNSWIGNSCTLNSWVEQVANIPDVVKNAGIVRSDGAKPKLVNLVPYGIWLSILPELQKISSYESEPWSLAWENSVERSRLEEWDYKNELMSRMRRLIKNGVQGSKIYKLTLSGNGLGKVDEAVQALVSVLLESNEKGEFQCSNLQQIYLNRNSLQDKHIELLGAVFGKCKNLWGLNLEWNNIGDAGCVALSTKLPTSLTSLILCYNQISFQVGVELMTEFAMTSNVRMYFIDKAELGAIVSCRYSHEPELGVNFSDVICKNCGDKAERNTIVSKCLSCSPTRVVCWLCTEKLYDRIRILAIASVKSANVECLETYDNPAEMVRWALNCYDKEHEIMRGVCPLQSSCYQCGGLTEVNTLIFMCWGCRRVICQTCIRILIQAKSVDKITVNLNPALLAEAFKKTLQNFNVLSLAKGDFYKAEMSPSLANGTGVGYVHIDDTKSNLGNDTCSSDDCEEELNMARAIMMSMENNSTDDESSSDDEILMLEEAILMSFQNTKISETRSISSPKRVDDGNIKGTSVAMVAPNNNLLSGIHSESSLSAIQLTVAIEDGVKQLTRPSCEAALPPEVVDTTQKRDPSNAITSIHVDECKKQPLNGCTIL